MAELIAKSNLTVVVGLGQTGMSVARYLAAQGRRFMVMDSRARPPNLERLQKEFPQVPCELGTLNPETLCAANEIILSPGVAKAEPAIAQAITQGVTVVGDIELFSRVAKAPIIAITGSNAKSTVTTLVAEMAKKAGRRMAVGGNIGTPVLDLLSDEVEFYVLEISSFQLETTEKLNAAVACILNISADHLDRYTSMMDYHTAKQRIYFAAKRIVINRDDLLTQPPIASGVKVYSFGLGQADINGFGLRVEAGQEYISFEFTPIMAVKEVALQGRHNVSNVLAALAIGYAAGLPLQTMLDVLREFTGLPHRCEWIAVKNGIDFINDSKATNVGATIAAIEGLTRLPAKLIVIAGGEGKGADFSGLRGGFKKNVRAVVLIGRDREKIAAVAQGVTRVIRAQQLSDAVISAYEAAQPGDAVVLSPACASFDMFADYEDRGRQFVHSVRGLSV